MKRKLSYWVLISSLIFAVGIPVQADSLWNDQTGSFYQVPKRKMQVGDILTILISESTSAAQGAGTNTEKQSAINADFLSNWNQVANILGNDRVNKTYNTSLGGGDRFSGSGQTTRTSQVRAVITAMVTEVMDNGNLFILGEHKVKVNNEVQVIKVSGIVRPQDISDQNSVRSAQIAKAEVSINGAGVIGSEQQPGIMTKMFDWLF